MNKEVLKTAAKTLRALHSECEKYAAEKEIVKLARELVKQLAQRSELSSKDVLEKLAEFESKTSEEIQLMQKALEFANTNAFMKLGHLTEEPSTVGMDNLTAFLISGDQN
jgi:hypothetical protein